MEWFRVYHGMVSDDKWSLISRKSGQPRAFVVAVWSMLLEIASQDEERGNVEAFDPEVADALFDMPDGAAQAIYDALCSGKNPRIANGCILSWEKRQPKREREESDSAERVRRHRERKRLEEEQKRLEAERNADETPDYDDVTPCNVTVTPCNAPRTEKNREEKKESVFSACACEATPAGERAEAPEPESAPCRQPSVAFDEFFEAFPVAHRGGRTEAEREWVVLEANRALPGLPRLLDALGQWEDSETWKEQGGRFIPSAANFLKREYWLRKPPEPKARAEDVQSRPKANTVAQQQTQNNDDMAKMLLMMRRNDHAQPELHASLAGQSGHSLPASL